MPNSTIVFVRKGRKVVPGLDKHLGRAYTGRLHVGYLLRDWTKVFYSPSINADEIEKGRKKKGHDLEYMPAVYTASGSNQALTEGEIAFLPHFDPKHIQAQRLTERDNIHKKTLYDAFRYLNEYDRRTLARLDRQLDDPDHRRWHTLFKEVKRWKENQIRQRTAYFRRKGFTDREIEEKIDVSDNEEDEGFGDEEDDGTRPQAGSMAPPPRPPKRPAPGSSSNARKRQNRGPGSDASCPLGRSGSNRSPGEGRQGSQWRFCESPGIGEVGVSSDDSVSRDSSPDVLRGRMGTPERPSEVSDDPVFSGNVFRSFSQPRYNPTVTRPLSIGESHDEDGQDSLPNADLADDDRGEPQGRDYMNEYQGGLDEEAAIERAITESMTPAPPSRSQIWPWAFGIQDSQDEDADIQKAIRESLTPVPGRDSQVPSEADYGASQLGDTGADNHIEINIPEFQRHSAENVTPNPTLPQPPAVDDAEEDADVESN